MSNRRNTQCVRGSETTASESEREQAAISARDTRRGLTLLAEISAERDADLLMYEPDEETSDNENGTECPHFDRFYEEGGAEAIIKLTNFDPEQFLRIWGNLSPFVAAEYNVGRGRKSPISGKDAFFMVLVVLKHGGAWDFLAKIFGLKGPTFEAFINKFVNLISFEMYSIAVNALAKKYKMGKLLERKTVFKTFPYARYATDVTFQQSYRPSGSLQEAKRYYSAKHKLYGYKVEVSVLPNGYAIGCTRHYPGSESDVKIFQFNQDFHLFEVKKSDAEADYEQDVGELSSEYPDYWAILADKGYQGAAEFIRVVHPKKKPPKGELTRSDEQRNKKIASDRIIVENYFGRMCGLWNVVSGKWKWSEKNYDVYFRLCVALTNLHIRWNALRAEDGTRYCRLRTRTNTIGVGQARKRKMTQQRYRERRRARMDIRFHSLDSQLRPATDDV